MCDNGEEYLCFYCEEYIKDAVKDLIREHKEDILRVRDWWYAIETANDMYDINVHCLDDENFEKPEAVFSINLYRLDLGDTSSYTKSVQFDLEPMTRKEINDLCIGVDIFINRFMGMFKGLRRAE
jgi:hypothetical protein